MGTHREGGVHTLGREASGGGSARSRLSHASPQNREPVRVWCPSLRPAERWGGRPRTPMISCRHHNSQSSFLPFLPLVPWDQTLPVLGKDHTGQGGSAALGEGRHPRPQGRGHRSCLLSVDGCPGALPLRSPASLGPGILRTTPGAASPAPTTRECRPTARPEGGQKPWPEMRRSVGRREPATGPLPSSFLPGASPRGQAGELKGLGPVTWSAHQMKDSALRLPLPWA